LATPVVLIAGDGIGLALEAGADLIDMEMVQFHPTGMVWPPSMIGTLVTEGVRGDGGTLKLWPQSGAGEPRHAPAHGSTDFSLDVLPAGRLACGFALAGIFILSRRGNIIATLLQMPIYFLAGFVVPVASLPVWVQPFSNALPVTHAAIALRQTALLGYTTGQAGPQILACFGVAAVFCVIGYFSLRRVEHVAKYAGQLDLY